MIRRATHAACALLRDRRGISALEFGIIAPVMFLVLLMVFQLGYAAQEQMQLHEALRVGGQYAMSFPTDTAGIMQAIKNVEPSGGNLVNIDEPTVADSCACFPSGDTRSCSGGNPCATAGDIVQRYKTLSVSANYTGFLGSKTITSNYVVPYQ